MSIDPILVRILKSWSEPNLLRQSSDEAGLCGRCHFTLDPIERCDYLVVLNHIPHEITIEVAPQRVWCFVQEPPEPVYRWIEKGFRHYGRIYTQDRRCQGPKIYHSHGSLPWHVARSYDELRSMPLPAKSRDLSWITSNLSSYEGHRRRLRFLHALQEAAVPFDLFGRGFRPIADKWDGLAPYRYALAVENHSSPDYWTEKIADCFLAGTMPIYFGATNIDQYFPEKSFVQIDIDDPATPRRIREIVASDRAERNREAIAEARRLVLEEHNFFPRLARLIAENQAAESAPSQTLQLPAIPDLTSYYQQHTPAQRLWHGFSRRVSGLARDH
ncbi:MAG TPA: glycosyltransferase family 10 [Chthoniobacterales bacterium]